jgi:cytochrome c5
MLPEWVPATAPITNAIVEQLRAGDPLPSPTPRIWDGRRPNDFSEWVALGERVFYEYPLRPEIFAHHALLDDELARAVGLTREGLDEQARWPGVIAFVDLDGETKIGITCAICHVGEDAERALIPGRARRNFDYGRMRLAYYEDTGSPLDPKLAARMATWGPGRADITDDEDEDPVAIPDLWGVRELRHLTQAATLTHEHPTALAIRQETQLLHANREQARPPRELAWALAMYVYSLAPPPRDAVAPAPEGEALFRQSCERCHSGPTRAGDPIPAERVGTDPALAFGRARGTGLYRPAPLWRVADAGPYLHDGSVATLELLLDADRLADTPGHAFGTERPADERAALFAYLRTL